LHIVIIIIGWIECQLVAEYLLLISTCWYMFVFVSPVSSFTFDSFIYAWIFMWFLQRVTRLFYSSQNESILFFFGPFCRVLFYFIFSVVRNMVRIDFEGAYKLYRFSLCWMFCVFVLFSLFFFWEWTKLFNFPFHGYFLLHAFTLLSISFSQFTLH
jgi:hypothetical protein